MMDEVEQVRRSLNDGTFYIPVTSEERRAVMMAMSKEFKVTGHWYNCENGHPFTIGECGQPMEMATCPICGAMIGGQSHRAVDGVTRATELEREFERMGLDG